MPGMDKCGCPDDRCIGYHHYEHEPCGCVDALTKRGFEKLQPSVTQYLRQASNDLRIVADNIDRIAEDYASFHERFTPEDIKDMHDLLELLKDIGVPDLEGAIEDAQWNLDPEQRYGSMDSDHPSR